MSWFFNRYLLFLCNSAGCNRVLLHQEISQCSCSSVSLSCDASRAWLHGGETSLICYVIRQGHWSQSRLPWTNAELPAAQQLSWYWRKVSLTPEPKENSMSMFIVIIPFCSSGLFCLSCVYSYDLMKLAELFPSRFDWDGFLIVWIW